MTCRATTPEDLPTVEEWYDFHRSAQLPLGLIPPTGVMVEDDVGPCAVLYYYLYLGVGICRVEWPISRPGLSLAQAGECFAFAVQAVEAAIKDLEGGYGVLVADTLPGIARVMERHGFQRADSSQKITMMKGIN